MALKTKQYVGLDPRAQGMHAREIVLRKSIFVSDVLEWLGEAEDGIVEKGKAVKIRVKTRKGVRLATLGDTIVKVGTRHNGNIPEFFVVKA
jgi:hypothetical protein